MKVFTLIDEASFESFQFFKKPLKKKYSIFCFSIVPEMITLWAYIHENKKSMGFSVDSAEVIKAGNFCDICV